MNHNLENIFEEVDLPIVIELSEESENSFSVMSIIERNASNIYNGFINSSPYYTFNSILSTLLLTIYSNRDDYIGIELLVKYDIIEYYDVKSSVEQAISNNDLVLLNSIDDIGIYYPIQSAITTYQIHKNLRIFDYLVNQRNCNVDVVDDSTGSTAISLVVIYGYRDICELLLKYKVNIEISDKANRKAIHYAICYNRFEIFQLLFDSLKDIYEGNKYGNNLLHIASFYGRYEIANYLIITKNYNISSINNNYGISSLHLCAMSGQTSLCELLLFNKIDINLKDRYGLTAAHYAVRYNHLEILILLLKRYDNITMLLNNDHNNILDIAIKNNHYEIINYLVNIFVNLSLNHTY